MSAEKTAIIGDELVAKRDVWAKVSLHPRAEFHYFKELNRTELMGRFAGVAQCGYQSTEIQTGFKDGETPPRRHCCSVCWRKVNGPGPAVCGVQEDVR